MARKKRPHWYLDPRSIRPKTNHTWTEKECKTLYSLRMEGRPVREILEIMNLDKVVKITGAYNKLRTLKNTLTGRCPQCRKRLTKKELLEQIDVKTPKCTDCRAANSKYKRRLRIKNLRDGKCGICGKHPVISKEHTTCKYCLSADYRRSEVRNFCGRCHDRPISKDSTVFCDICLERNRINTANYRKAHASH